MWKTGANKICNLHKHVENYLPYFQLSNKIWANPDVSDEKAVDLFTNHGIIISIPLDVGWTSCRWESVFMRHLSW